MLRRTQRCPSRVSGRATVDIDLNYKTGLQSFQITAAQGPADLHVDEILSDVAHAIFATYDALNMAAHDPNVFCGMSSAVFSGLRKAIALARRPHTWRDARVPWEQSEPVTDGHVWTLGR